MKLYKSSLLFTKMLIPAIFALIAVGCQGEQGPVFAVAGSIENVDDDYVILFFKSNLDGSTTHISADTLKNGCFKFTAPAETGVQYHVVAPHVGVFPSMSLDFYAEPGAEVEITCEDYLIKN